MDERYNILNSIRKVEKKHSKTKQYILDKIDEHEKIIKDINFNKDKLKKIEEEYIELIEQLVELNEKNENQ